MKLKYIGKGIKGITKGNIYEVDKSLRYENTYYLKSECGFKIINEKEIKNFEVINND